jgi:shikimate kinase
MNRWPGVPSFAYSNKNLKYMKVLIFGPSGSGKTFVSQALKKAGINAFDDADIKGLSAWYDKDGNKVAEPATADEAFENHYSFLWSKKNLAKFLQQYTDVYVFGGSGNIFTMLGLFDKTYFLKIDPELQQERILNAAQRNPAMDQNKNGLVIWGDWLEQEAKKHNIPFIDASLTPQQIFALIAQP